MPCSIQLFLAPCVLLLDHAIPQPPLHSAWQRLFHVFFLFCGIGVRNALPIPDMLLQVKVCGSWAMTETRLVSRPEDMAATYESAVAYSNRVVQSVRSLGARCYGCYMLWNACLRWGAPPHQLAHV